MSSLRSGPNREEEWDSPASPCPSKQSGEKMPLPPSMVVNVEDVTAGGERKEEPGPFRSWSKLLLVAVVATLCVSQALQWAGWACPGHSHGPNFPALAPPTPPIEHTRNEAKRIKYAGQQVMQEIQRQKRNAPEPLYITLDHFLEEKASLLSSVERATKHPTAQFYMKDYTSKHEIVNQVSLFWSSQGDLFTLGSDGRELEVKTPGSYHIDLTVMFNGRTYIRGIPSCSLKVVSKRGSSPYITLMYVSTTQDQRGLQVGTYYPIDTAHGAGLFVLNRGDKIHVKPDNWSLGCRIMTEPTKTHMDIFLVQRTTS